MGRDERLKFSRRQIRGSGGDMIDAMSVVIDRFGRQLTTGDIIVHNPANPIAMQIVKLVPLLDPTAPPGLVTLTAVATFNFHIPKGKPLLDIILVDMATEQEEAETRRQNVDGEAKEDPARTPEKPSGIVLTDAPPAPPEGDDDA